MDLKEKRKMEINNQKEKRKEDIIIAAIDVFKEKGINDTKMTDIAQMAEIGIATLYRYFNTKMELVIAAATFLWEEEISTLYEQFKDMEFLKLSGKYRVKKALGVFITIYNNYPEFMSFLEHFDNYVIRENIDIEKLDNYEKNIMNIKTIIMQAIETGKADGTIKKDINGDKFYITITHCLMSLSQKLILRGAVIKSDREISGEAQLEYLIEMAVTYISKD